MKKNKEKKELKPEALNTPGLTLVHFRTEWNAACQIVSMIYDDLAKSYEGAASFYTIDMETEDHLVKEYGVTDLPTILFFKAGKIIDHATGLIPKNILISKIESALTIKTI